MSRLAMTLWLAIALVSSSAFAQSEIRWFPELATARRAAAQFQVPMLIHFYGDNCLPCKTLEQRVLNQDSVIKTLNKYFICVRVNASQDRATATEYQVHSWQRMCSLVQMVKYYSREFASKDIAGYMEVLQNVAVSNRDRNTQIAAERAKQSTQSQLAGSTLSPQSTTQSSGAQPSSANPALAASTVISGTTPANQFQVAPPSRPAMMDSNVGLPPLAAHLASQPLGSDGLGTSSNVAGQMNAQKSLPSVANGTYEAQKQTATQPAASLVSNPYYPESEAMVCTPDGKCGPASTAGQFAAQAPAQQALQNKAIANNTQNKWMQSTSSAPVNAGPQFPPLAGTSTPDLSTATAPTFQPKSATLVGTTRIISNDGAGSNGTTPNVVQPNTEPKLGLIEVAPLQELEPAAYNGYCPISLVKTGLKVQGKTECAVRHRGRTYLMESPEAVREFMQTPDRFSPVLSGYDPMVFLETGKLVDGTLDNALYDPNSGMIILFSSADSQTKFKADPARNTKALGYILNAATKK